MSGFITIGFGGGCFDTMKEMGGIDNCWVLYIVFGYIGVIFVSYRSLQPLRMQACYNLTSDQ